MTRRNLRTLALVSLLVAGCGGGGSGGGSGSGGSSGDSDGPVGTPVAGAANEQYLMDFWADRVAGPLPLIVKFTVTPAKGVVIASYQWELEYGLTSTEASPEHHYVHPGQYSVRLTINTTDGRSSTLTKSNYIDVALRTASSAETLFVPVNQSARLGRLFAAGNTHTGGSAWIDYNGDYWPDLFISNGAGYNHYLFRNRGDGTFDDVSQLVRKPDIDAEDAGAIFADIDNDGDEDLLVMMDSGEKLKIGLSTPQPNSLDGDDNLLFINQGDGTFVENAAAYGVVRPDGGRTSSGGFADYDRDGFIDLYLGSWAPYSHPDVPDNPDLLLRNQGNGTFAQEASATSVDGHKRDALVSFWFDSNRDRWPDLYVGNIGDELNLPGAVPIDALYVNNADHGFTDRAVDAIHGGNDTWAAMGADVGDIDNDGDWDLYITDEYRLGPVGSYGNTLYKGEPDGKFSVSSAREAGIHAFTSWPCNFADLNLDGWVDLWVGAAGGWNYPSWIYINQKDGTFSDQTPPTLPAVNARGGSSADYDGDGDVDFVMTAYFGRSQLIRNDTETGNNWLSIKLSGVHSNRAAIGTLVHLRANGLEQMRRVSGGDSSQSQSELIIHFGVGQATRADLTIEWPSGIIQVIGSVETNQLVFIDESAGLLSEDLESATVIHDSVNRTLQVTAASSFGGRTGLTAVGYGPLDYNAGEVHFSALFSEVDAAPGQVTIQSDRGGSWVVDVSSAAL